MNIQSQPGDKSAIDSDAFSPEYGDDIQIMLSTVAVWIVYEKNRVFRGLLLGNIRAGNGDIFLYFFA